MNYISLHNHSKYSVLDGFSTIEKLVYKAVEFGMPAVSLTDHGNTAGLVKFYKECIKNKIKPILGVEFYFTENISIKNKDSKNYHITALAYNNTGYKNILKLSSLAEIDGFYYKPRIDFNLLEQYKEGIIFLSGCLKNIILSKQDNERLNYAKKFKDILGENFYIEIMPFPTKNQIKCNIELVDIATKLNIPLVVTCDTHYIEKNEYFYHDAILALKDKKALNDKNRLRYEGDYYYFRSYLDVLESFSQYHNLISNQLVKEALENTVKIAHKCNVTIDLVPERVPEFPVEETDDFKLWQTKHEQTFIDMKAKNVYDKYLLYLIYNNWSIRLSNLKNGDKQIYKDRLNYEIDAIFDTNFSNYFIIIYDIIDFAHKNDIMVGIGRGSCVGSLVSYVLGITQLDPIKFELSFDRFIIAKRANPPDIDLDFEREGRDTVISYLTNKYGKDHTCKVSTISYLKARAAIKDAARLLGYEPSIADQIVKSINFYKYKKLSDTLDENIKFVIQDADNKELISQHRKLFKLAYYLYDTIKSVGVHPAAFIITDKEVTNYTAVKRISDDEYCASQYDMNDLKDIGVMKFDLLAVRNLDTVKRVIKEKNIKLEDIPLNNEQVYKNISNLDVTGVFQMETPSSRKVLQTFKISDIDDLVAMMAINRPGALLAKADEMYQKNKLNKKNIKYANHVMKEILEPTYGCLIYQEQLMDVAKKMAGFSVLEADKLRKQISAKDLGKFNEMKDKFIAGCSKNGFKENESLKIWKDMEGFARYAFNKSHSAAYAVFAYYTAYMKHVYTKEYLLALINTDKDENMQRILKEFKKHGFILKKPDINLSKNEFTIHNNFIVAGFNSVARIGESVSNAIINSQPYNDFIDFLNKVDLSVVNKSLIRSFVAVGIINRSMYDIPSKMLYDDKNMQNIIKYYKKNKQNKNDTLFKISLYDICTNKINDEFTDNEIKEMEKDIFK